MPISLDSHGYVTPYGPVTATVDELNSVFVKRFPKSSTRRQLFEGYLEFCKVIVGLIGNHMQWLDGSFTGGKLNPGDIDVLCFVEAPIHEVMGIELDKLAADSKQLYGVDLHIIKVLPDDHPRWKVYDFDRVYWLNQFTKTRRMGHRQVQYNKGFLELYVE